MDSKTKRGLRTQPRLKRYESQGAWFRLSVAASTHRDLHDGTRFVFHQMDNVHHKRLVICDSVEDSLEVHLVFT